MATTRKTPFGEFRGENGDGVVQYLGIKYASLKDQLNVPEMVESYGNGIVDATQFGPRVPASDYCEFEQNVLIQSNIGAPTAPPMSGIEGLNLNITVPDVEIKKPLPVMVYIHGGGFIMGSNHWPQYDFARLVKLSAESGTPIIGVNFNYRLGILGNLTSEELRKAGYPGNNSLRDQRCALQWIKAHISGFGGDPENVTCFGESAGSTSVFHQLFSKEPLFKRAICMSGSPLQLKALSVPVTEMAYGKVMQALSLEHASAEERVQRLKTITPEELVAKTPSPLEGVPMAPYLDGFIVPRHNTFKDLSSTNDVSLKTYIPGTDWCKDIMIGDCQHDGNVYLFMGLMDRKAGIASALNTSFTNNIGAASAAAVLEAYNITPATDDDAAMTSIIDLATDIAYVAPALTYVRALGKYYYNFNEPNPWDGPFKGCSTHILDAAFLFQNFREKLGKEENEVAMALAKDFIAFASGKEPWNAYDKAKGNTEAFGPSNEVIASIVENNGWGKVRRGTLSKLQEEGKVDLDALSSAWDLFVAGK